jgi:LDH2 family malate/lactate/ureidoglycolate dehydrogenase
VARYPLQDLTAFVEAVLVGCDVLPDHAATTASRMVEADVRGMSGHGVMRLPSYVRRFEAGGYNLRPDIRAVHETPVSALVDGDNGLGHVVMTTAAELALAKAAASGLAWVGVRRSNHAGAGGVYASMALDRDMIGIYLAIGNAAHMAPWGGVDPLMSTNPIAVAIPAGEEPPIVFDMATTVASYGRIKVAAQRGERLPEGWVIDRQGAPITDPARASEGLLLPIGGYKGYGLNLVVASLAGVLNGAASGGDIVDFNADFTSPTNTGQSIIVIRPDLFGPLEAFQREMDRRIREIRTSTPIAGGTVRLPGSRVPQRRSDADRIGVEVERHVVRDLTALADRRGIPSHPFGADTCA